MKFRDYYNKRLNENILDTGNTSTDGEKAHKHKFEVDTNGNGKTTITLDHYHNIIEYRVDNAGEDEHTHQLGV